MPVPESSPKRAGRRGRERRRSLLILLAILVLMGVLAAAAHKSKAEVQLLLARRFPQPDVVTRVEPISLWISAAGNNSNHF